MEEARGLPGGEGRKEIRHSRVGMMVFEHAGVPPQDAPEQRLILYSPLADGQTPGKVARLLAG